MANKYQEALDNLYYKANVCADCDNFGCWENRETKGGCDLYKQTQKSRETLQELINKEKPMKPIFDGSSYSSCDKVQYICPKCNQIMLRSVCITKHKPNYCYKCGQALDWSEDGK